MKPPRILLEVASDVLFYKPEQPTPIEKMFEWLIFLRWIKSLERGHRVDSWSFDWLEKEETLLATARPR